MLLTRAAGFGPEVKRRIMLGTYALSAGYYDAYYGQAQRVRTLIARDFASVYERFDALLSPTSPTVAFALGAKSADPLAMYLSDVCTIPTNLAGHCAISVPFGIGVPSVGTILYTLFDSNMTASRSGVCTISTGYSVPQERVSPHGKQRAVQSTWLALSFHFVIFPR